MNRRTFLSGMTGGLLAAPILKKPPVAEAIPPTSPTPCGYLKGTSAFPPDNLGGTTVNVPSTPASALQTAIGGLTAKSGSTPALNADGTHKGNTYVCPAGAVYNAFMLPATSGPGWTCIRVANDATQLPAGTQVTAADASKMFTVRTASAGAQIRMGTDSNGWRFIGMHVPKTAHDYWFQVFLDHCKRIIFERCYMSGTQAGGLVRNVFAAFVDDLQICDSLFTEAHVNGQECQSIFPRGGMRHHYENTTFSAAGECVMLGDQVSVAPCEDFTIKRCQFYVEPRWRRLLWDGSANPAWDGFGPWVVKNNLEIKYARRALIEGCVLENMFPQGQQGTAFLTNFNNSDVGFHQPSGDIMFRHNIIKNATHFIAPNVYNGMLEPPERLAILNNLGLAVPGQFLWLGPRFTDLWIEHNTCVPMAGPIHPNTGFSYKTTLWLNMRKDLFGTKSYPRFTWRNNVWGSNAVGPGVNDGQFLDWYVNQYIPLRDFRGNAQFGTTITLPTGFKAYASAAAAGINVTDGTLVRNSPLRAGQSGHNGTDGQDVGVDFAALNAAQAGSPRSRSG